MPQETQHTGGQDLTNHNNNSSHNQLYPSSHAQRGINILQQNHPPQPNSNTSQNYINNRHINNNGDCGMSSIKQHPQHNITVQQHSNNQHQIIVDQHNNIYQQPPSAQAQIMQQSSQQITSVNSNYLQSQQQRIYIPQQSQHQFITVAASGAPHQQIQIQQPQQLPQQQIHLVTTPVQQLQPQQLSQSQQYIGSQRFYANTIMNSGTVPSCSGSDNLNAKESYRELKRKFEYLVYVSLSFLNKIWFFEEGEGCTDYP